MNLRQTIELYDPAREPAVTPPSSWYTQPEFADFEKQAVFSRNWIMVARLDQLSSRGQYVTEEIAGEPVLLVNDGELKAFYNVCRHHAAAVVRGEGTASAFHCPYHGWTYNLDGSLRSTPNFGDTEIDFSCHGLVPLRVEAMGIFVFITFNEMASSLGEFLGSLVDEFAELPIDDLKFHRRVEYELDCNWKVFVDNYLDGGYHVPILHKGLASAIDNNQYQVRIDGRYCLQTCPMTEGSDNVVRKGGAAKYYWLYPNVMFNFYDGILDTNLTVPIGPNRCRVIFDYYFSEDAEYTAAFREESIRVSDEVQQEDESICLSVQQGLQSRAYEVGPLSPEKEVGERHFHQLLYQDYIQN
jgi:choline monooxygenase